MCVGETDWKILAIDINDPLADQMNSEHCAMVCSVYSAIITYLTDIQDIEKHMPGFLKVIACIGQHTCSVLKLCRLLWSGCESTRCQLVNLPMSLPSRANPKTEILPIVWCLKPMPSGRV